MIDINGSMSPTQIRSLVKSLEGNSTAKTNADTLTRQLRQNGMLGQNQSVLGMSNGNVFTSSKSSGSGSQGSAAGSAGASEESNTDDTDSTNDTNRRRRED